MCTASPRCACARACGGRPTLRNTSLQGQTGRSSGEDVREDVPATPKCQTTPLSCELGCALLSTSHAGSRPSTPLCCSPPTCSLGLHVPCHLRAPEPHPPVQEHPLGAWAPARQPTLGNHISAILLSPNRTQPITTLEASFRKLLINSIFNVILHSFSRYYFLSLGIS